MASKNLDTPTHGSKAAECDLDIVVQVDKKIAKEWHGQSDLEFRAIIVQQCLQNLFSISDIPDLDDSRVRACFELIRDIELAMFLTATNRGEYYHFGCVLYTELHAEKEMLAKMTQKTEESSKFTNFDCSSFINVNEEENVPVDPFIFVLENVKKKLLKRFGLNIANSLIPIMTQEKRFEIKDPDINTEFKEQILQQIHAEHETLVLEAKASPKATIENCQKKHEHENFIPIKDFTIQQLPVGLRNEDLFEFVVVFASITVAIEAFKISDKRPKNKPHTEMAYPFSEAQDSNQYRCGTGRICNVTKHSSTKHHFSKFRVCPCQKCKASDTPKKEWGEILVFTAAHIVFDNSEAENTICKLFYDNEDSDVVILNGISVVEVDIERDWCRFKCASCDMKLITKLEEFLFSFFGNWYKIYQRYKDSSDEHRLTIIVSHPHGGTKQISLGKWEKRHDVGVPYHSQYLYRTSTCPGSSGATVHLVGINGGNMHWFDQHIHSGVVSVNKDCTINFCGVGWENEY